MHIWATSFTNIHGVRIQSTNPRFGGPRGEELIQNQGTLQLDSTSFVDVGFRGTSGGLLVNMGTASLVNVFVSPSEQDVRGPIRNQGRLTLTSVTMVGTNSTIGDLDFAVWNEGGPVRIGNSIFADFQSDWCNSIQSLGHNLIEDGSCKFRVEGDITNQPSGLLPISIESGPWDGPVSVRRLAASSLAVDSGHPELCITYNSDALGTLRPVDGNNDGVAICDRGAVEFISNNLSSGGVTGLFYDPASDGHYVQVLETTYNTMITWNTVDRDGNQAWVYGIGQLVGGQSFIADAYINRGGRLTDNGPVDVEPAESWGTIQLEMDSCTSGRVIFSSVFPEFGDGMFSIRRLANSRQIGCQD